MLRLLMSVRHTVCVPLTGSKMCISGKGVMGVARNLLLHRHASVIGASLAGASAGATGLKDIFSGSWPCCNTLPWAA